MPRLRLRTFGGLALEGTAHGKGATPKGRRPLALLALLATSGSRGLSRDKVTALLWPESDAERGRNSLSQVLSSLRRELGPDDPVLGTAEIRLNADAITSDVGDFETSVAHGDVERAVTIPSGPFLDGFYLTDAPEFERWVEEQRARLNEKQRDALKRAASHADRRGDRAGAVALWRRLAALDPTSAGTAAGLMEGLAASGDVAAALRHFQVYTALLEQELHVEPDAAVVRLAERLRRGDGVPSDALTDPQAHAPRAAVTASPRSTVATVVADAGPPPFWGRIGRNGVYALAAFALLVGAFIAVRAAGVGPFATLMRAGKLGPNELVLVADFKTIGPDSALSGPLAQMMRSGLSQSRVIGIVPLSRIAGALERMARTPDSRIDLSLAREIAQREGIKAVVGGTLTPLPGGAYLLSTQLVLASTGDELASFQATADGAKDLVAAVDSLSRQLRERIGESLKSVRADPPLADVTTRSLDALKKYTAAVQAYAAFDFPRAIALLDEAIGLDSNFAMAYRQMAVSMDEVEGRFSVRLMMMERAYRLRDRLPEPERLETMALYYFRVLGDPAKARATYEELLSKYPRTEGAAEFYAWFYLGSSREFARAESVFAALIAADTSVPFPYVGIASAQIAQGKLADARRSVDQGMRRFRNRSPGFNESELQYALGQVDSAESIMRTVASSASQPHVRSAADYLLTTYALLRGHIAKARTHLEAARALATAAGGQLLSLQDTMTAAQIQLVFFNRRDVAAAMLDSALKQTPRDSILEPFFGPQPYLRAASLYALAGRPDKARAAIVLYDRDVKDTAQRRRDERDRQSATANIDLAEGRASVALTEFRHADRLFAWPAAVCAVWIDPDVGRAFDRAGMLDSAITAYEHFVNAPALRRELTDAWNLHWILKRLGELYEARGDSAAAATYYQRFVTLWKDADPDLQPVVADVRRRLSRLGH